VPASLADEFENLHALMERGVITQAEFEQAKRKLLGASSEGAEPYAGKEWTDSGKNRDRRQLKQRARGEIRTVPCPPELTALVWEHIDRFGFGPERHPDPTPGAVRAGGSRSIAGVPERRTIRTRRKLDGWRRMAGEFRRTASAYGTRRDHHGPT
jgi:hypothetical protein